MSDEFLLRIARILDQPFLTSGPRTPEGPQEVPKGSAIWVDSTIVFICLSAILLPVLRFLSQFLLLYWSKIMTTTYIYISVNLFYI
jgi:hypothetical protein